MSGKKLLGARDAKKLASLFGSIAECEKAACGLLQKTAKAYFEAGAVLAAALKKADRRAAVTPLKELAEEAGFPERRVSIALKIFKAFEHNPSALDGLPLRDAARLVAPPSEGEAGGYNRIDLGGDPGQMQFDFGELFGLPPAANRSLQNYRTVADLLTEIIVVRRKDDLLTSKRFLHFCEDVPQGAALRHAYKDMVHKTQAAIEDYLAALEQEEIQT